jgi:hypothetical protein
MEGRAGNEIGVERTSHNTMITAKVRSIFSLDVDGPLSNFTPEDTECFELLVRVMVGPQPGEGEESFDISVCTPTWLARECERFGWVLGHHRVVFTAFHWASIESTITRLIEQHSGSSWREVALKVAQIGHWEFSDYRDSA